MSTETMYHMTSYAPLETLRVLKKKTRESGETMSGKAVNELKLFVTRNNEFVFYIILNLHYI